VTDLNEITIMAIPNYDDNQVVSHTIFAHDPAAQGVFATLRADDPLHWTVADGHPPFWAVTKHSDLMEIGRRNDQFLNEPMSFLRSDEEIRRTQEETSGGNYVRALTHMDEPDHRTYRGITQGWFMPTNLKRLEGMIDQVVATMLDKMAALGSECDFASDIAPWIPLRVIMTVLGVPDTYHPHLLKLTQELLAPLDPHHQRAVGASTTSIRAQVFKDFYDFFRELVAERRIRPTDDLSSVIANMQINGHPAPELETLSYFVTLSTAGHDTTASSLAGGVLELARDPNQMTRLRDNPALINSATEEIFRWVSPVKHFMRTAKFDCVLRGKEIRKGDLMMLCFPSANRDEEVFPDAGAFKIDRSPNRHLGFGFGVHSCLGQNLARMEVRAFLKEFVRRVGRVQISGVTEYVNSRAVSGPKFLPIRYSLRA
jgi:cytochrome P450